MQVQRCFSPTWIRQSQSHSVTCSVHVLSHVSVATMEWRAAEAPECIWEVLSLNTQPKGKCLPLSVKNSRGFFCLLSWSFPDPQGWEWVWIMCRAEKLCSSFPIVGMWWLHPWLPCAGNVPWDVTSSHCCPWAGTYTKPKSWCFTASPSANENPGDNSAWLSLLFIGISLRTGPENMGEVQDENMKHRKHDGEAIAKRKQGFISFSSSLESCSSPSSSP